MQNEMGSATHEDDVQGYVIAGSAVGGTLTGTAMGIIIGTVLDQFVQQNYVVLDNPCTGGKIYVPRHHD
jgi:hypothetical protein